MAKIDFNENMKSPYTFQGHEYFVKVTTPIEHPIMNIETDDSALINDRITPEAGDLVLCGSKLERWNGQDPIDGVVVQVNRSI